MTGPEHYRRAEALIALSIRQYEGEAPDDPHPLSALTMAQAQVHATLALAASTAAPRTIGPEEGWGGRSVEVQAASEWREATTGQVFSG